MALLTKEHIIEINKDFPLIIEDFANTALIEKELKTVARSKYAALENIIKKEADKAGYTVRYISNKIYDAYKPGRKRGVEVTEEDAIKAIIEFDKKTINEITKNKNISITQNIICDFIEESEKLKEELEKAKNEHEPEERRLKIADALGINRELITIKHENGDFKSDFFSDVVSKVIQKGKGGYRLTSNGKNYIVSKELWKKLLKEQYRYTDNSKTSIVNRKIESVKKTISELEETKKLLNDKDVLKVLRRSKLEINEDNKEAVYQKVRQIVKKVINKRKVELENKARQEARRLKNEAKKAAYELRDALRRQDIAQARAHYAKLKFDGPINNKNFIDTDEIIKNTKEEIFNEIEKEFGVKKDRYRIANLSSSQRLVDSEHIHKPAENTWYSSYESNKDGSKMVRKTESKPKNEVQEIYQSTLKLNINLLPEWEAEEFKLVSVLKPSIVKQSTAKWTERQGKETIKHEVDYGCLLAATYFYTLVASTPIDEPYRLQMNKEGALSEKRNYWDRARIAIKKQTAAKSYKDGNKSLAEIAKELEAKGRSRILNTHYVSREHKPDEESVRGDWVMTFRGVTFKAFDSEPASNSESVTAQVCFNEEDFMNPVTDMNMKVDSDEIYTIKKDKDGNEIRRIKNSITKPYIWKIAEIIAAHTEPSDDISVEAHNINPRWQVLEYGGYKSGNSGPWAGSGKYGRKHGVKNGFSWQAPMGFKRIVDAQYNSIITHSSLYKQSNGRYGNASSYTRPNRSLDWNFDISKMDASEYARLRKLFNKEDHTLSIDSLGNIDYQNIHNINSKLVWELKEF